MHAFSLYYDFAYTRKDKNDIAIYPALQLGNYYYMHALLKLHACHKEKQTEGTKYDAFMC